MHYRDSSYITKKSSLRFLSIPLSQVGWLMIFAIDLVFFYDIFFNSAKIFISILFLEF